MINGNVNDFINGLHYGDERYFIYNNVKYFIEGLCEDNNKKLITLFVLEPKDLDFRWEASSTNGHYPVAEFEQAKIFNGKSFWEIEKEIEWVDE